MSKNTLFIYILNYFVIGCLYTYFCLMKSVRKMCLKYFVHPPCSENSDRRSVTLYTISNSLSYTLLLN